MPFDDLPESFTRRLAAAPAVVVEIVTAEGSTPREAGTWMAVFDDGVVGTIGGGRVEHEATAHARAVLAGGDAAAERRFALGPSLGQCCGGAMRLRFERVDARDTGRLAQRLARPFAPLALFGGGHVGRAIVQALAPLRYAVTWIDSRDEVFPPAVPANVACEHSDPVQGAVPQLAAGSRVLVMSFSHAEDLDIVAACLARLRERGDLPFVGLIGSRTKWATFRRRLAERGFGEDELARITCPIGIPGIIGKEPAVIAASAVAQLLQVAPPA